MEKKCTTEENTAIDVFADITEFKLKISCWFELEAIDYTRHICSGISPGLA